MLQQIDLKQNKCQALILAPTRELAQQIQKVARALGDFLNVSSHACVGGTLVRDDIKILREGVQIVVGTPGRVYDMIKRQELSLANVKIFVLDESVIQQHSRREESEQRGARGRSSDRRQPAVEERDEGESANEC